MAETRRRRVSGVAESAARRATPLVTLLVVNGRIACGQRSLAANSMNGFCTNKGVVAKPIAELCVRRGSQNCDFKAGKSRKKMKVSFPVSEDRWHRGLRVA